MTLWGIFCPRGRHIMRRQSGRWTGARGMRWAVCAAAGAAALALASGCSYSSKWQEIQEMDARVNVPAPIAQGEDEEAAANSSADVMVAGAEAHIYSPAMV